MPKHRNDIRSPRSPLPCAPPPSPAEGLLGYRLHLSDANRYPKPTWIYDGPIAATLLRGYEERGHSELIERLAVLTTLGCDELAQALLFPKKIYVRSINLTLARVCPRCLEESPFLRKLWDLSLFIACPIHNTYLLSRCPSCKTAISWSRSRVTTCTCGFDFRSAKMSIAEVPVINLTRRLAIAAEDVGTIEYCRQPSFNFNDSFPDLDLPLDELCTLIMFLGGLSIHGIKHKTFMQPRMIEMPHACSLVQHTSELFQTWPLSLQGALQKVQASNKGSKYAGLRERFGYMYTYLYNNMPSHHFDFLRRLFEEFVRDNFVGHLSTAQFSKLSPAIKQEARYVSPKIAAKQLKVPIAEVRHLVQSKALPGEMKQDKSGRYKVFIERQALDGFTPARRDLINLEAARKLLGLEKYRARELLKSKRLKSVFSCSKGARSWRISKSRIDRLLITLCADLPELKHPLPSSLKTLRNLLSCYVTAEGHFPFFLQAVLNKKISPVGRRKDIAGISGLVFRLTDVRQLFETHCGLSGYCDIDQGAEFLGEERSQLYRLLEAGFLKTRIVPIGFRGRAYIRLSDLRAFKKHFITTPEITRLSGHYRITLRRTLSRMGIKPIRSPRSRRVRVNVYRRTPVIHRLTELRGMRK